MSEPRDEEIGRHDGGTGDDHLHQSPPDQEPHPASKPVDGGSIFSMYLKRAEEEDKRTAEGWKEEAEKVFLFTGLFSAVVATFISMSIQGIQANPQDTSNFYLASIHQALTNPNRSNIPLPSSPPPFSPPTYGIWVNSFWFLSLVISITCAVLANLLQQWARKYLKVTRPRPTASEPKRARYHAFYADGVENFLLPWVFEALPAMLHLSVFLFFAGLVVFLWKFDPTISKLILSWVAGCVILYGYITFIPTFRHDSPYHTPLTPIAWRIITGIPCLTFSILGSYIYLRNIVSSFIYSCIQSCISRLCPLSYLHIQNQIILLSFTFRLCVDLYILAESADRHRKKFVQGLQKTAEKAVLSLQSGLSKSALMWTFDSLHEDDELELFFSSLPGFRGSNDEDVLPSLTENQKENLWGGLVGLLDRTLSSDSLHEPVKNRRAKICAAALHSAAFPYILDCVISDGQYGPVRSAEITHFIGRCDDGANETTHMLVRAIVSGVVATAQLRNDSWFTIASEELGVEKSVLLNYSTHDLSLAILIHVTCKQFNHFRQPSWPSAKFSKVLRAASKFEVRLTSPALQYGFCALWIQIFRHARLEYEGGDGQKIAQFILKPTHKVYGDIYKGTRAHATPRSWLFARIREVLINPLEYPLSYLQGHHSLDLPPHDNGGSTDITFARIVALACPTSETSTRPLFTTAPRASPVMTHPGDVAQDDGEP